MCLIHFKGNTIYTGGKDDVIKKWDYKVFLLLLFINFIRVENALIHLKDIKRQFEAYPFHLKDY